MSNKYVEFFNIDESYHPCISKAIIDDGKVKWDATFPHSTFIKMLEEMEKALSRQNNGKTLWIEGAYGTGKSQCAYALRKILEVPEDELCAYWNKYEPLKSKPALLQKLLGHKDGGIVVVDRESSGDIRNSRDLIFAIQESVKFALKKQNIAYQGENTIKESIIVWLEDEDHKLMFNSLLNNKNKEWKGLFAQSNVEEILNKLRKSSEVKSLVNNIFTLADKEGITALSISADRLVEWLVDIIDTNKIKIVFVWDEFSDYFENNKASLSDFQKIISLVQSKPFYFIVVTHETQQMYMPQGDKNNQTKLSDRFVTISISLPDNIAFELIAHAFSLKEELKEEWDVLINQDLIPATKTARDIVVSTAHIQDENSVKRIMPIQPMTALVLKNISQAFKSNQRSMFDFIKSSQKNDVKAFQWYIENYGPEDDFPVLTIDMLWDFFYENGRENLPSDIRMILDTFPMQQNLREEERSVLKTILIMQAIDLRLGGNIDLFKATDRNLSYAYEGVSSLDGSKAGNIAKGLKEKGILIANMIAGNQYAYAAAVLAGDQSKIDEKKKEVRKISTASLVDEGELSTVLSLTPALRLRFEKTPGLGDLTTVTLSDFTRIVNGLRDNPSSWKTKSVIAFAKDDAESATLREMIKNAVACEAYKEIVFIDALSSPLGADLFEQYVEHSAMAMYYQGNTGNPANESKGKAKKILEQTWKKKICDGRFIVYTFDNKNGDIIEKADGVKSKLQSIVLNRFPMLFDFEKGLTEAQLKLTNGRQCAFAGIEEQTKGVVVGIEKSLLPNVWKTGTYWENNSTKFLDISKIKISVDDLISKSFAKGGQVSIGMIFDFLVSEYGFSLSNVSAFLTGFLLKEYGKDLYRYADQEGGHVPMSKEKLAEMIGNQIGKQAKPTYIVKMTPDEKSFYELSEKVWSIPENACSSVSQVTGYINSKIRSLKLPIWVLEYVDDLHVYDIVEKYLQLVQQNDNRNALLKAIEIGKIYTAKPSIVNNLNKLITTDNCKAGMTIFLNDYKDGVVIDLAERIGAKDSVLSDVAKLFETKYSCLWEKKIGEDELDSLRVRYSLIEVSNRILNSQLKSLSQIYCEWKDKLKTIRISSEALKFKYPSLDKTFEIMLKILKNEDTATQIAVLEKELVENETKISELFYNDKILFRDVYKDYLDGLNEKEIDEVKSTLPMGMIQEKKSDCNIEVKKSVEEYKKKQLKTQMINIWKEKTSSKNPLEWSATYGIPVLCCVEKSEFDSAKKVFDILNRGWATEKDYEQAIEFLNCTSCYEVINSSNKRIAAFQRSFVRKYSKILTDHKKVIDALECMSIDVYDWYGNPAVEERIKKLAEIEYNAGGSKKAIEIIDKMNNDDLKKYLSDLIENSVDLGIEILVNEEDLNVY